MSRDVDFVVIGASVGGLAAGATLAQSGARVLVVEKELAPPEPQGALFALDPALVSGLRLAQHGLSFRAADLALTGWDEEEPPLTLTRDRRATQRAIAAISQADAEAWGGFQAELAAQAKALRRWWAEAERQGRPSDLFWQPAERDLCERLGLTGAAHWLGRHFESPQLIGTLLRDAVAGGFSPIEPGSSLALVWRAAQEMGGQPGAVALPVPGTLVAALRRSSSAVVQPGAAVTEILLSRGRAAGVRLDDGETVSARAVLSSLPQALSERLAGLQRPQDDVRLGEACIGFTLRDGVALPPELQQGRCVAALTAENYADAHEAARAGKLARVLPFEVVAETPRRLTATVPLLPLSPPEGWAAHKAMLAARLVKALSRHVPGLGGALSGVTVTAPSPRRGASLAHLLAPARERAATRIPGLYLCGADAEPVACVSGRAGRFAAQFALKSR